MKIENLLIYGGLGYLAYHLFFKDKSPMGNETSSTDIDLGQPMMDQSNVGLNGRLDFKYVGASALRTDESGREIYCGVPGNPFASAGVEGRSATTGVAPTTYYAMFELGDKKGVNEGYVLPGSNTGGKHVQVGDTLDLQITGGQFSALDNQRVTVLQRGSDKCTPTGQAEGMNTFFVVDVPIILEGAGDSQYPPQEAVGYATRVNF